MSGGSRNYLYSRVATELYIPSGTYGIGQGKYNSYNEENKKIHGSMTMISTLMNTRIITKRISHEKNPNA